MCNELWNTRYSSKRKAKYIFILNDSHIFFVKQVKTLAFIYLLLMKEHYAIKPNIKSLNKLIGVHSFILS